MSLNLSCLHGTSHLENILNKSERLLFTIYFYSLSIGRFHFFRFKEQLDGNKLATIDRSTALAVFDWYHLLENVIDGSENWKETCGSGHLHYHECPGDPLVTWKRGYSALFDILMVTHAIVAVVSILVLVYFRLEKDTEM